MVRLTVSGAPLLDYSFVILYNKSAHKIPTFLEVLRTRLSTWYHLKQVRAQQIIIMNILNISP